MLRGHSRNQPKGGRNSLKATFRDAFLTFFSVYTQKEFRRLFKGLKLLYFVQNSAQLVALDWSRDIK